MNNTLYWGYYCEVPKTWIFSLNFNFLTEAGKLQLLLENEKINFAIIKYN